MYTTSMIDHHARWKKRADELSHTLKLCMILGEYFIHHYRGHYYGKAQNARRFRRGVEPVRFAVDAHATDESHAATQARRTDRRNRRTRTRNVAEHRAVRRHRPSRHVDSVRHEQRLPVGTMLIGKHFDEAPIYRGAYAFEQTKDWKKL